ncbi:MAG: peptidoglycan DD-metalloendopeptidase family protein, partial [Tannerellaceae bacterium]|nr:peptidoglycan DD-metalloendopeptidase family protein [Tannerellaceae bacterium]
MSKITLYLCTILLLAGSLLTASAQKSDAVRQLEAQRKTALAEIELTDKLLKETTRTAQTSLNRLNLIAGQILSRKKVIDLLNRETQAIDSLIISLQEEISNLERELKTKQDNYKQSAQRLQRRQTSQDKLLFILSAESFTQSMRRMRYLREFAYYQKRQASDIVKKQKEIVVRQANLKATRDEKQALLQAGEDERRKLQGEEENQKKEVQEINKKQKDLQAQLRKKRQQADALNRQIEKLIAEEIAKAEAEAKASRERTAAATRKPGEKTAPPKDERTAESKGGYAMTPAEKKLSQDFADNRGRLPLPLEGRYTIVGYFGEQQHQQLKYVRMNNSGIDIQTTPGTDAQAVFSGEVTSIFVVPGFNSSVIVRHGNYLTVYSNLSQVYVKKGDKVTTRQPVGKIFSDAENGNETILHF